MALRVKHNPDKAPDRNLPLNIRKLSVTRLGAPVLRDLSFSLAEGEIVGINGINGAGKSTLVATLSGVGGIEAKNIQYDDVLHRDEDLLDFTPQQRYEMGIHCVFEGRRLFGDLTVRDNLSIAVRRKDQKKVENRISEITDLFPGMKELLGKKAKNCSGGQQQIIAIARSIMEFPSVLILDEPTLGLSPRSIDAVADVLKVLASGSVGIVLCEQRVGFVDAVADRKLILERGKLHEPIDQSVRAKEWKPKIAEPVETYSELVVNDVDDDDWKPL